MLVPNPNTRFVRGDYIKSNQVCSSPDSQIKYNFFFFNKK